MKRHHVGKSEPVENDQVAAFLAEIVALCKRYGFSLGHEDTQGAFIVERYDEDNIQWLMDAMVGKSIAARGS
jgi:sugar phosphate isomerase/epimerase